VTPECRSGFWATAISWALDGWAVSHERLSQSQLSAPAVTSHGMPRRRTSKRIIRRPLHSQNKTDLVCGWSRYFHFRCSVIHGR